MTGGSSAPRDKAADDGERSDRADLHEIDALDVGGCGAEYLERGDAVALDREIGGDAVAHPDAGDDKRSEPDQREELPHALEEAVGARRGAVAVLERPAGGGMAFLERFAHGMGIGAGSGADTVLALEEAAGLDEAGAAQAVHGDQCDWPEREAFADAVGLVGDDVGDGEGRAAVAQLAAAPDAQPLGQRFADDDAVGRERTIRAGAQGERAVERIEAVHALELGQHGRDGSERHPPAPWRACGSSRSTYRARAIPASRRCWLRAGSSRLRCRRQEWLVRAARSRR